MDLQRNSPRFHLTPEGWVRAGGRTGRETGGDWRDRPAGAVETWEWSLSADPDRPHQARQTWVNGRVHQQIRESIRTSFPPPVDGVI